MEIGLSLSTGKNPARQPALIGPPSRTITGACTRFLGFFQALSLSPSWSTTARRSSCHVFPSSRPPCQARQHHSLVHHEHQHLYHQWCPVHYLPVHPSTQAEPPSAQPLIPFRCRELCRDQPNMDGAYDGPVSAVQSMPVQRHVHIHQRLYRGRSGAWACHQGTPNPQIYSCFMLRTLDRSGQTYCLSNIPKPESYYGYLGNPWSVPVRIASHCVA